MTRSTRRKPTLRAPIPQRTAADGASRTHAFSYRLSFLIGWAKANPGKVFYASSGIGSTGHLTGLLLNKLAGIDMQHIGYKGSAGAVAGVRPE